VAAQTERFRVAWVDTDAGGRIHFTAAFRWAEATEVSLYRRLGLLQDRVGDFPRRHVEAEFRRVLVFDDELEVQLRVDRVGRTSITYRWEIVHAGETAIEGRHTVVHVDREGRPEEVDDELRRLLSS
jgi:YbgC/YbaW family acyl-CoA thioester hydrolase